MAEMNPQTPPALLPGVIGNWKLDPATTTIAFATKAMWGLARVKGSFRAVEGGGSVAEDGSIHGRVVVDATSIDTKNKRRDAHLRSTEFFDVEKYPTFSFEANGTVQARNGVLSVHGELIIRSISRPTPFEVRIEELSSARLVVRAEAEIDRRQFGMTWAKMGAGMIIQAVVVATFTRE